MKRWISRSWWALVCCAAVSAQEGGRQGPQGPGADLVVRNAAIWTGERGAGEPRALAIHGARIAAVGSNEDVAPYVGPHTRVIDAGGRRVLPGFVDAHVHFLSGGDELLAGDLRSASSEEEFARRVGRAVASLPPGTWFTSGAWDHQNWPDRRLPTAATLDRYTGDHPVFIRRLDGHMAVANSLALRLAGVAQETPDPPGGEIVRDADGRPTGVLKDAAMALVHEHVPPWTPRQRLERARAAIAHAVRLGVTCVHDMGTDAAALRTYQELRARGELHVRIRCYVLASSADDWTRLGVRRGFGDDRLSIQGVKAFADGSLGSGTALFLEPYADRPDHFGLALTDLEPAGELEQLVRRCREAGLQPAVHAIGDAANRAVLDVFERALGAGSSLRPRIEHAQHIHPDDLPRFEALGVLPSMQPYHAIDDGRWAECRIGAERCRTSYAFGTLHHLGARLALGSDWPVAPLDPMWGIYAAVTRATLDGRHPEGWIPQERLPLEDALRAYTAGGAFAAFDEDRLGTLLPGKLADLVILDRDPFTTPPHELHRIRVERTIVGGRVVFERRR